MQMHGHKFPRNVDVFVKSRGGGSDDDNKPGADGIAETHDNGKDDDDSACQFVIVRVAGVARI